MTEAEWLACTDPKRTLDFLKGRASDRKLRLFACAGLRQIHHLCWPDAPPSWVLEVAERFADGMISDEDAKAVLDRLGARGGISSRWAVNCGEFAVLEERAEVAAHGVLEACDWFYYLLAQERHYLDRGIYEFSEPIPEGIAARQRGRGEQAQLLVDIFVNPFARTALDTALLTTAVSRVAETIYDSRAFDRMPELAEALEHGGCTAVDILTHCRSGGPHVRGCRAVDLILGKQ